MPYADAISSVFTSLTPRTAAGTAASGPFGSVVRGQHRIPIRTAASTSAVGARVRVPVADHREQFAYATLTELTVALSSEIVP